jgi:hypothetical protein
MKDLDAGEGRARCEGLTAEELAACFNGARLHQGIGQRVPSGIHHPDLNKPIAITPALGGLHTDYRRAA